MRISYCFAVIVALVDCMSAQLDQTKPVSIDVSTTNSTSTPSTTIILTSGELFYFVDLQGTQDVLPNVIKLKQSPLRTSTSHPFSSTFLLFRSKFLITIISNSNPKLTDVLAHNRILCNYCISLELYNLILKSEVRNHKLVPNSR